MSFDAVTSGRLPGSGSPARRGPSPRPSGRGVVRTAHCDKAISAPQIRSRYLLECQHGAESLLREAGSSIQGR
jgi:hypothetical protein